MDNGIITQLTMPFFCLSSKWPVEGYIIYLKSHTNTTLLQATTLHRKIISFERPQLTKSGGNRNIDALIRPVLMSIEKFWATLEHDIYIL
jgi:hypothetical protein